LDFDSVLLGVLYKKLSCEYNFVSIGQIQPLRYVKLISIFIDFLRNSWLYRKSCT